MASTEKYINSICSISHHSVKKNGEVVFSNAGVDMNAFLVSVYQHFQFQYPKFYKMDNLSKLGWLVAEILLAEFKKEGYPEERVSVILSNANASLDTDVRYMESAKEIASPGLFVYTLPNIVIGEICIRHKFKGENAFFIQENFDAEFTEAEVSYLLDNDLADACICGWADVLEQDYNATFFLVEKQNSGLGLPFQKELLVVG